MDKILVYAGVSYEKTSTSKYSSIYGGSDFTSTSLHCDRVSPTVCSEPSFGSWSIFILVCYVACHKVLSVADYRCVHLYSTTSGEAYVACYTETHPNLTGGGESIWPWIL